MVHHYKIWMASQTVVIHSTLFYTHTSITVNHVFKCCWGIFSQSNSTTEEVYKRMMWTNLTAYGLWWRCWSRRKMLLSCGIQLNVWNITVLSPTLGQVREPGRFQNQSTRQVRNVLVRNGGGGSRYVIRSMHLHRWQLPTGGSKPENLIFTGQSHKAIAEHAGLSTAPLQQQVVKAKLLQPSGTKSEIPGADLVGKSRK